MRFYSLDIGFKSSSYLTETLLDPEFGHAYEPNKAAFNKAYNVNEDLWSWFERPDNRLNLVRFAAAMNGSKNASPANAILEGSVMLCCKQCMPPSHLRNIEFIFQGTTGKASLRDHLLSTSEAVLARSP